MKNKIYIFLLIVLCAGCTANYQIDIETNKISEKLTIEETNIDIFDETMDNGYSMRKLFNEFSLDSAFSKSNAKLEHVDTYDKIGINYMDEYTIDELSNSNVLNQCYENPTIDITENTIYINTGNEFNCFDYYEYLDDIKIILKTNNKVSSNNADNVKNNTYIWNLTRENYSNKSIEIDMTINKNDKQKNNMTSYIIIFISVLFLLTLVGILIYNVVNKKSEETNKF